MPSGRGIGGSGLLLVVEFIGLLPIIGFLGCSAIYFCVAFTVCVWGVVCLFVWVFILFPDGIRPVYAEEYSHLQSLMCIVYITHTETDIYIYVYIYIYVCIYIYIYTDTNLSVTHGFRCFFICR